MEDVKKIIDRLENLIENIKYGVNKIEDSYTTRDIVKNLSVFVDDILENSMEDKAIAQLDNSIDYIVENIKNNDLDNIFDIANYAFESAYIDGTLTFSTYLAEKEIFSTYSFDEIREKMEDNGIDFNLINSTEKLHIFLTENILREKLEEYYESNNFDNFSETDKLMYTVYSCLDKNGYTLTNEHQKIFEDLEKKSEMEFENNWNNKTNEELER